MLRKYGVQLRLILFHLRGYCRQLKPLLEPEFEQSIDGLIAHPYLRLGNVPRPQPRAAAFGNDPPVDSEHLSEPSDLGLVEVRNREHIDASVAVFCVAAERECPVPLNENVLERRDRWAPNL